MANLAEHFFKIAARSCDEPDHRALCHDRACDRGPDAA
jgi:hypothetical protein